MKKEDYDIIVKELEDKAQRDPKGYIRHVAGLALLGYAYIFGLIIFLLFVVVLLIWLLFVLRAWVLLKFSFLFLIAAWLVFKSLWVKFSEPEGIVLQRGQSPALFDLVDEIRAAAGGPKIHSVVLNEEFNCAIMQFPRLGMFGWFKNILILGLPLMQSVNLPQFKAVLAHEMGHLSGKHGKMGAWIYHVRKSWQQTWLSLSYESSIGIGLIKRFAEWFVPLFDAHTFVLMRQHEYDADKIASAVAGAENACQALIQTAMKGSYLSDEYWQHYWEKVKQMPEPPSDTFVSMRAALQISIDKDKAEDLLQIRWAKHDGSDTHPALAERVRALQPEKDWSNPRQISADAARLFCVESTAAEELFGIALPQLEAQVDAHWRNSIIVPWSMRHAENKENSSRLHSLEKESEGRELTIPETLELASLSGRVDEPSVAIRKHRSLLEKLPSEAVLHLSLGLLLLGEKDDEGIDEIEAAVKINPVFGRDAFAELASYLSSHGRDEEAEKFLKKSISSGEELVEAAERMNNLSGNEKYEEHKLTQAQVEALCVALSVVPRVRKAFLVAREVPEIFGGSQHLLLIELVDHWYEEGVKAQETLNKVAVFPELAGFFLIPSRTAPKALVKACKTFATGMIYDKRSFKGVASGLVLSPELKLAVEKGKPGFFGSRNKN